MVNIQDNFLPKESFDRLKELIGGENLAWYYTEYQNDKLLEEKGGYPIGTPLLPSETDESFQFCHLFYEKESFASDQAYILSEVLDLINPQSLIRIKANMTTRSSLATRKGFHTDVPVHFKATTAILYLNTCNGYTLFGGGQKVHQVANRFVSFDSSMEHTGVSHTDVSKPRILINFNYF